MTHLLALLLALSAPARAEAPKKVVKVAIGDDHTCALFEDGTAKCWGENSSGQLGTGDTTARGRTPGTMGSALPYVELGRNVKIVDIKASGSYNCALLSTGDLKCWGDNSSGQLALGDDKARGGKATTIGDFLPTAKLGNKRKVVDFSLGPDHACAILDNKTLKCWGGNNGDLGLGDTNVRGTSSGTIGDSLPAVDVGTGRYAIQVSAGYAHTCALLDNYTVKCWGDGSNGQLGQGNTNSLGDNGGEMGDALKPIDLGTMLKPERVFAASTHTCVLLSDRTVKCWGDNSNGGVGAGNVGALGDKPGDMGMKLPYLDLEPGLPVGQMSCARRHCCVGFTAGTLKCWGQNSEGELGIGDSLDRGSTNDQMGVNLPFSDLGPLESVRQVETGRYNSCAILADGAVKCWGLNSSGQLGLGDQTTRGLSPTEMGSALPRIALF